MSPTSGHLAARWELGVEVSDGTLAADGVPLSISIVVLATIVTGDPNASAVTTTVIIIVDFTRRDPH